MPNIYTTIQGDTWDGIAKKAIGSEYFMSDLMAANLQFRNTVIFSGGVSLVIPKVDTSEVPSTMPAWKRGGSDG